MVDNCNFYLSICFHASIRSLYLVLRFYITIKVLPVNTMVERGSGRRVPIPPLEKPTYTLFRFKEKPLG